MEAIKTILIACGILFIIQIIAGNPEKTRPLRIQDCIQTNGSINVGCVQEVNSQYGF